MTQTENAATRRRLTVALWTAGFIAVVAVGLYVRSELFTHELRGGQRGFPRTAGPPPNLRALLSMLGVGSVMWYLAFIALPIMLWRARRIDGARHGWGRVAAGAVASIIALAIATSALQYFIVFRGAPMRPSLVSYLPVPVGQNMLVWMALFGFVGLLEARRRSVHSMLEQERLRTQVAEQRLIALTGQLQPHFLFNTLQGIATLFRRDPDAAEEMLEKLSDLLRELLRQRDRLLVPIADELRYARTYLEISRLRFAGRLEFDIEDDPSVAGAAVPLFILQPLVENAVAHGIGGRARGGRIVVRARRVGDRLRLDVTDDGPGLSSSAPVERVGLTNTRERLRATFGEDQSFALESAPGGGVVARVDIPFRQLG